jgi:CBS domain-containing protein
MEITIMRAMLPIDPLPILVLDGKTAAEIMTPSLVSLPATATLEEAAALLTDKHLAAVPVLNSNGDAVGVLSRTDLVAHERAQANRLAPGRECKAKNGPLQVQSIMTPVVIAVSPETPASTVVRTMLGLSIHRVFVTGIDGTLLGVVSSTDILRQLHGPQVPPPDAGELLSEIEQAWAEAEVAVPGC